MVQKYDAGAGLKEVEKAWIQICNDLVDREDLQVINFVEAR